MPRILGRRPFSRGARAVSISDRSGLPFPYREFIKEKGTNAWIHRSEDDGIWNRVDYEKHLNIPAGDAQRLENPRNYPEQEVTEFY